MYQRTFRLFAALLCAALAAGCAHSAGTRRTALPVLPAPAGFVELPTAAPLAAASPHGVAHIGVHAGLGDEVVARVNGRDILRRDYEQEVARAQVPFSQQPGFDAAGESGRQALLRFRLSYLDVMIDQVLIEEKAAALGIVVDDAAVDDEYARLRGDDATAFAAWLSASHLTPEALREQLRRELLTRAVRDAVTSSIPRVQPQLRVSHILAADETAADAALARIRAGESFADVARDLSEDAATRDQGGDLGYLPKGVMPPAFDGAAFSLTPGQPSGIVQTETGLHILLVTEPAAGRPVSDAYWPAVQQYAFDQWLAAQRDAALIERGDWDRTG